MLFGWLEKLAPLQAVSNEAIFRGSGWGGGGTNVSCQLNFGHLSVVSKLAVNN